MPEVFITEQPIARTEGERQTIEGEEPTNEGDNICTEGAARPTTEGDDNENDDATIRTSNCTNDARRVMQSPKRKAEKIRTVNGERIGSKRNTATGMSRKRLTKLLEKQIAKDEEQTRIAENAVKQSSFEPAPDASPATITQDVEPVEPPESLASEEPSNQHLCRSPRLQNNNHLFIFNSHREQQIYNQRRCIMF